MQQYYDILCILVIPVCVNYLSSSFILLHTDKITTFWGKWHYCGHVIALLVFVLVQFVPKVPKSKDGAKAANGTNGVHAEVKPEALKKEE